MKKDIHPDYHHNVTVRCACGNEFTTGSVIKGPIRVEICAACHPFFTGEQKFVDTEGRVEKFQRKQQEATAKTPSQSTRTLPTSPASPPKPRSLRQMLEEARGG